MSSKPVKTGRLDWDLNVYDCPAGFSIEGLMREAEQSLIESGCQHTETSTSPMDGSVWNGYHCPPSSRFEGGEPGGLPGWVCLVSPDRANAPGGIVNGAVMWVEITRGQCVPPLGGGGAIWEPTGNGQSTREVNVEKIAEPASSDSQGESDQQRANGDVAQVDEEARGEGNKASNQSQENNDPKKGYGCSANP